MKSTLLCFSIVTAVCAFTSSAQAGGHQGSQGMGSPLRSQAGPAIKSDHLMTSKSSDRALVDPSSSRPTQVANQSTAKAPSKHGFTVAPWLTGSIFGLFRHGPPDNNPKIMGPTRGR
jgi:hypothetical protein